MPAIFDSLVASQDLTPHKAWRVAYIVPFIIITAVALSMLFFCEDTPTGKWSERHLWLEGLSPERTSLGGDIGDTSPSHESLYDGTTVDVEKKGVESHHTVNKDTPILGQMDVVRLETVVAPTRKEALKVAFSLPTLALAIPYACSFGAELAINSILGTYFAKNFPKMGQTESGRWAAMFGLLNVVCRPAGGFISDMMYRATGSVWAKKLLLTFFGLVMGAFLLAIGLTNPTSESTMFGLIAGLAFFLEANNGTNFALVPHVHPYANGRSSWCTAPLYE